MDSQTDMMTTALAATPEGTVLVPTNALAAGPLTPHVLRVHAALHGTLPGTIPIGVGDVLGWQLHLPWEVDPLPMNGRKNRWAVASAVRDARTTVEWLSTQIPRQERIRVELVQHVTDRRDRDPDNLSHTFKAVVDGLRDDRRRNRTGIVADDTPRYVDRLHPRIEYHKPDGPRRDLPIKGWFRLHVWPAPS